MSRNEEVVKPRAVHRYNINMGPIDILDLVILASQLQIKTSKWWKSDSVKWHFHRKLVHELFSQFWWQFSKSLI